MLPRWNGLCYNLQAVQGSAGIQLGLRRADMPLESQPAPGDTSSYCPACWQPLEPRRCKLICPACGYYMSCSDYC